MPLFPYKHPFILISAKISDDLDLAANKIHQECVCGGNSFTVPFFGEVVAFEMRLDSVKYFEFRGCTYNMYSAVIASVGVPHPIRKANPLFENGADLLICQIAHYSDPDTIETAVFLNSEMPNTSSIKEIRNRLLEEKLKKPNEEYGRHSLDGFCDADFPIHASLYLQRLLAINPAR
ncbi:MAG: hypothetical protein ACSHWS_10960 [Sulfitobacter sp.]